MNIRKYFWLHDFTMSWLSSITYCSRAEYLFLPKVVWLVLRYLCHATLCPLFDGLFTVCNIHISTECNVLASICLLCNWDVHLAYFNHSCVKGTYSKGYNALFILRHVLYSSYCKHQQRHRCCLYCCRGPSSLIQHMWIVRPLIQSFYTGLGSLL